MTKQLHNDLELLIFLEDGETYSGPGDGAAVLAGDWDGEFPDEMKHWETHGADPDDEEDHKAFHKGIKEVLRLNRDNLLKIKEKLPELWEAC
jgi:hypothetical protein